MGKRAGRQVEGKRGRKVGLASWSTGRRKGEEMKAKEILVESTH